MLDGKGLGERAYDAFHAARYAASGEGGSVPWARVPRWKRKLWEAAAQTGFDAGWAARAASVKVEAASDATPD